MGYTCRDGGKISFIGVKKLDKKGLTL